MMKEKFTKGPWSATDTCSNYRFTVVRIGALDVNVKSEADAHLIAAAPDYYNETEKEIKFLAKIVPMFPVNSPESAGICERMDLLKNLQAKARGEK